MTRQGLHPRKEGGQGALASPAETKQSKKTTIGLSKRRLSHDTSRGTEKVKKPKSNHRNTDGGIVPSSVSEEDFNIRSSERTQLLATIRERTREGFSPTLWGCFQLCDIGRLREMAKDATSCSEKTWLSFLKYLSVQDLPSLCKHAKLSSFYKRDINIL
jgi:hypothetical protein